MSQDSLGLGTALFQAPDAPAKSMWATRWHPSTSAVQHQSQTGCNYSGTSARTTIAFDTRLMATHYILCVLSRHDVVPGPLTAGDCDTVCEELIWRSCLGSSGSPGGATFGMVLIAAWWTVYVWTQLIWTRTT